MNTYYFSFGWGHAHSVGGYTYDKDVICAIKAKDDADARIIMSEHFGENWAMCYWDEPDMRFFPRGIKNLNF